MFSYRQFHDETNIATVVMVTLAELGVQTFDPSLRGQELVIHGLLQHGRFLEGRGTTLARAVKFLFDRNIQSQILLDAGRTAALKQRLLTADPNFDFALVSDLGSPTSRGLSIESDVRTGNCVMLVESRHAVARLPLHVLLLRSDGDRYVVMNSATGENHMYSHELLSVHLGTPVSFGAQSFAGLQYLYTGIAIRLNRAPAHNE